MTDNEKEKTTADKKDESAKKDQETQTKPEGSEAGGDDGEGRTGTKLGSTDS